MLQPKTNTVIIDNSHFFWMTVGVAKGTSETGLSNNRTSFIICPSTEKCTSVTLLLLTASGHVRLESWVACIMIIWAFRFQMYSAGFVCVCVLCFCKSRNSPLDSFFLPVFCCCCGCLVCFMACYHCFSLRGSVFDLFLVNVFQSADCQSQFSKVGTLGESDGYRLPVRTPPLLPSTHCSQAVVRNLQQQMERLVFQNPEYHLLTVTPIGTEGAQGPVPHLWKVVIFWVGCFSFLNPSGLCQNSFTSMLVVDFLM